MPSSFPELSAALASSAAALKKPATSSVPPALKEQAARVSTVSKNIFARLADWFKSTRLGAWLISLFSRKVVQLPSEQPPVSVDSPTPSRGAALPRAGETSENDAPDVLEMDREDSPARGIPAEAADTTSESVRSDSTEGSESADDVSEGPDAAEAPEVTEDAPVAPKKSLSLTAMLTGALAFIGLALTGRYFLRSPQVLQGLSTGDICFANETAPRLDVLGFTPMRDLPEAPSVIIPAPPECSAEIKARNEGMIKGLMEQTEKATAARNEQGAKAHQTRLDQIDAARNEQREKRVQRMVENLGPEQTLKTLEKQNAKRNEGLTEAGEKREARAEEGRKAIAKEELAKRKAAIPEDAMKRILAARDAANSCRPADAPIPSNTTTCVNPNYVERPQQTLSPLEFCVPADAPVLGNTTTSVNPHYQERPQPAKSAVAAMAAGLGLVAALLGFGGKEDAVEPAPAQLLTKGQIRAQVMAKRHPGLRWNKLSQKQRANVDRIVEAQFAAQRSIVA